MGIPKILADSDANCRIFDLPLSVQADCQSAIGNRQLNRPHPDTIPFHGSRIESFDVAVVGAGVFGAWTAYQLNRAGAAVVLVDAYGPGNSRASSGGESRVIRMGYGPDADLHPDGSTLTGFVANAVGIIRTIST